MADFLNYRNVNEQKAVEFFLLGNQFYSLYIWPHIHPEGFGDFPLENISDTRSAPGVPKTATPFHQGQF
jgi:hypothetical protein